MKGAAPQDGVSDDGPADCSVGYGRAKVGPAQPGPRASAWEVGRAYMLLICSRTLGVPCFLSHGQQNSAMPKSSRGQPHSPSVAVNNRHGSSTWCLGRVRHCRLQRQLLPQPRHRRCALHAAADGNGTGGPPAPPNGTLTGSSDEGRGRLFSISLWGWVRSHASADTLHVAASCEIMGWVRL